MAAPPTLLVRPFGVHMDTAVTSAYFWDEAMPHTCYYVARVLPRKRGAPAYCLFAMELPYGVSRALCRRKSGRKIRGIHGPYIVLDDDNGQIEVVRKDTGCCAWRRRMKLDAFVGCNDRGVVVEKADGAGLCIYTWKGGLLCASIAPPSTDDFCYYERRGHTIIVEAMNTRRRGRRRFQLVDTGAWVALPYSMGYVDGDATMSDGGQYYDMDGVPIVRPASVLRNMQFYRRATRTCVWENYSSISLVERIDEHNWKCTRGTYLSPSTEYAVGFPTQGYPRWGRLYPWRLVFSTTGRRDALQARVRAAYLDGLALCEGMHHDQAVAVLKYLPSEWWGWEDYTMDV